MYGGVVGGSTSAVAEVGRLDRSMSRKSRRALTHRQASFSEKSSQSSGGFNRTASCTGLPNRSSKKILNRSATVIGNRSTLAAEGVVSRNSRTCSDPLYENQEKEYPRREDPEKAPAIREEVESLRESCLKERHRSSHRSRRPNRSFYRRFITVVKQAWTGVTFGSDSEEEEVEQEHFHRPDDINALCRTSHISRSELQRLYRAFKDRCPTGLVTECAFKEIYCQLFPIGASASQYAHYVFLTLDRHGDGVINFEDLIALLSRLSRGTLAERLCWIFSLYDLNNDGYISRSEMLEVVQAVYDLLGKHTTVPVDGQTIEHKVTLLFEAFDTNKDDLISLEEFIEACSKDPTLVHNLEAMSNYL